MEYMDHLALARQSLRAGDTIAAVTHATAAMETGDATQRDQAHLLAGVAWTVAGSWTDAEGHLLEALAGELGERKAQALYHLALVYEHTRRIDVAAGLYAAAADLWRGQGRAEAAVRASLNACWMLATARDLDGAREHLEATTGQGEVALARQALAAYLQLWAGDLDGALATATAVAEAGGEPWPICLAAYVGGTVAVLRQRRDLVRQMYEAGAAVLPQTRDTRLMNLYVELRRALV